MSLRHIIFKKNIAKTYTVAILIKDTCFNKKEIKKYYVDPLVLLGIPLDEIIVFNLLYTKTNKAPAKLIKNYLSSLLKICKNIQIKKLLVADPNYFKTLTKQRKSDPHYGYVLPCAIKDYENIDVILTLNYASLFYNPTQQTKIDRSLDTLVTSIKGIVILPGSDIIHSKYYPDTLDEIKNALKHLHAYPGLAIDIETYSLTFNRAKIATIAFAWDEHNGIAINVCHNKRHKYGRTIDIYTLLLNFFYSYKGFILYHGATFDVKIIIYELFMKRELLNTTKLLKGLDEMYKNTHCTKIIAYLATNTTAGNHLSLKELAAEFAGNWALDDITDITLIPTNKLLRYNLIDTLSTWYVYNKYWPILIQDKQEEIYRTIYQPSMKVVTQMELTGMPMNFNTIQKVEGALNSVRMNYQKIFNDSSIIFEFQKILKMEDLLLRNSKLKKLVKTLDDIDDVKFNPNSNKQVGKLLHEYLDLPIMDLTDGGAPSVGADSLKKHLNMLKLEYDISDDELKN